MRYNKLSAILALSTIALLAIVEAEQNSNMSTAHQSSSTQTGSRNSTIGAILLEGVRSEPLGVPTSLGARAMQSGEPKEAGTRALTTGSGSSSEEADDSGDDDNDDDADDDEDDDDDDDDVDEQRSLNTTGTGGKVVSDIFGNKIKLENNRTILVSQNKARDLGLLTIKAIILGPLIGLTLKAALLRGMIWAVGAYLLHTFFPSLLGSLGLGTGLVGFARQLQPDYAQMLLPHLANIPNNLHSSLPTSLSKMLTQYRILLQPVVNSIASIPEGHCRFRAVCETASYLIRSSQSISSSLQRLSATVYLNFGTDYSKAWLDGIVQSDCAVKYAQCKSSPFSMVAARLAEAVRPKTS